MHVFLNSLRPISGYFWSLPCNGLSVQRWKKLHTPASFAYGKDIFISGHNGPSHSCKLKTNSIKLIVRQSTPDFDDQINFQTFDEEKFDTIKDFWTFHVWAELQAFLDFLGFNFRDFRFNEVYNSILFSSPLVLN